MNPICKTSKNLSKRTWLRLKKNFETGITLREDGITAINLQDLYRYSPNLTIIDFSPHMESKVSGADWEWWFVKPGSFFGTAVQAKCLKNGTYDISYRPKSNSATPAIIKPLQIETLLNYAKKWDLTPQYCFYNYFTDAVFATLEIKLISSYWVGQIPPKLLDFPRYVKSFGCSIIHAEAVWQAYQGQFSSVFNLLDMMIPWEKMFCCENSESVIHPFNLSRKLRILGIRKFTSRTIAGIRKPPIQTSKPTIHNKLPERVKRIINKVKVAKNNSQINYLAESLIDEWDGELPKYLIIQGFLEEIN